MPQHITLVVRHAIPAGPQTRRLVLQDPDCWPLPRWSPGAHLDIAVPGIGQRSYSLCGDPARSDTWEVAIKREVVSRGGSAWLHNGLEEGDTLAAGMPRCTFPIAPDAKRHVMIGGGIGVTPFMAMAHELERRGLDWKIHVLSRGEAPCRTELARWPSTRVYIHDTSRAPRPSWDDLLGAYAPGLHAYCCGPEAMLTGFQNATRRWPEGTASIEHFVPPPLPVVEGARSYTLCRAIGGAETAVDPGASMLGALRDMGAKVDASCEGGICGACEVRWLEGDPIHRDRVLSPERRRTHLIACVAQCASERLILDI